MTFSVFIAVFIIISTQRISNNDNLVDDAYSQEYYTDGELDYSELFLFEIIKNTQVLFI